MAKIVKVYREELPQVRFIGKRYGEKDRNLMGTFADQWGEWFQNGWFCLLEQANSPLEDAYLGLMREKDGAFEYWIGMFFSPDAKVPEGFAQLDLGPSPVGTVWIQGTEADGDIYREEDNAVKALASQGFQPANSIFYERYACPRFTVPDENGEVILDICVFLEE